MLKETSPLFFERYELKYFIPFSMVQEIVRYVSGFCEMDYYSQISHDGFYKINSLYFDSAQFSFLRKKEAGAGKRYNLRVRSYGESPQVPYFFEVKEKNQDFVKKRRAKVHLENWSDVFSSLEARNQVDPSSRANLDRFLQICDIYDAKPVVFTQYRRLAMFSTIDDYARITFDKDLRCCHQNEYDIDPRNKNWVNYDQADIYQSSKSMVVLELKCESRVPLWMIDLIRRFELNRVGFSKYQNGLRKAYSSNYIIHSDLADSLSSL